MNINDLQTLKDLFETTKYKHVYSGRAIPLHPFNGIGEITNEETSYNEIVAQMGTPELEQIDDRGNLTVKYEKIGLSFKFLNDFIKGNNNPTVSFITIRKPFTDKIHSGIYPGLHKKHVHNKMKNNTPTEVLGLHETWKNKDNKSMKFFYDQYEKLESIIIF